ncbi:hypothetical protein RMATCC62417_14352 [Rhizopus microsporus]|nr:hypothetical protein RMATCC62417_14352 [Rhizopus microsporus]
MFVNTVKSDRFSVDFVFSKRTTKDASSKTNIDLKLEDFDLEEVKQTCQPMFLDSGRKSVFTAAIGLDTTNHQIRHCSTAEYYHMMGSTKYIKKLEKLKAQKGIKEIENNIPSPNTAECAVHLLYIEYILTHIGVLFTFYDYKTAKDRFYLYQDRQRAAEEMVNMLVHGDTKYNKQKQEKAKVNGKFKRKREGSCQKRKQVINLAHIVLSQLLNKVCRKWATG